MSTPARLVALARKIIIGEGSRTSGIDGVTLLRISRSLPRMPVLYEPSTVFVLQGRKRGFLGTESFVYDARHYLILSAALPFECETEATRDFPLLCVYVRMRRETIAELLASMRPLVGSPPASLPRSVEAVPVDDHLEDAIFRLLTALQNPDEARVLGSQIVREITYRVLTGRQGDGLRAAMDFTGHFAQINRALLNIHEKFADPVTVDELASSVGMSQSVFHLHFKAVTSTSPVQYIKAIRLHRARSIMLDEGLDAAQAARRVGYQSAPQFSREFKRLFGHTPLAEASRIRSVPMLDT
jgi:AraC-like DNA-binding protein